MKQRNLQRTIKEAKLKTVAVSSCPLMLFRESCFNYKNALNKPLTITICIN